MSVHRLICNADNLLAAAALSATAQRPSADLRLLERRRHGGGDLRLIGAYSGAADTVVEAEIASGSSGALSATRPQFAGVGSGTLEVGAIAPTATPCTLDLTLVDTGSASEPASLEFYGVTLQSRVLGLAGNGIELTVDRSAITMTPSQYSTLTAIRAGQHEFEGAEWDWQSAAQLRAGEVPPAAPRYAFEGYPQVHRHWREWRDARWIYRLDPAPEYEIPAGTRLLAVSGEYMLTVRRDTVSESYTGVTLYDFLAALRAQSALVEVVGTVAADRAPGGMAVTDLPLRSDAHVLPARASRSGAYLREVRCTPDAPTELITITHRGEDVWSVRGPVSGALRDAETGKDYRAGPVAFTLPRLDAAAPPVARITHKVSYVSRRDDEPSAPPVCLRNVTPGANMKPKSITFTYRRRPESGDCNCETMPAARLRLSCLGLEGNDMSDLAEPYATRLKTMYDWWKGVTAGNTALMMAPAPQTPPPHFVFLIRFDSGSAYGYNAEFYVLANVDATSYEAFVELRNTVMQAPVKTVSGSTLYGGTMTISYGAGTTVFGTLAGTVTSRVAPAEAPLTVSGLEPLELLMHHSSWPAVAAEHVAMFADAYDLDLCREVMEIFAQTLDEVQDAPAALAMWDAAWSSAVADLDPLSGLAKLNNVTVQRHFIERYNAACDRIRVEAGIVPKSDASSGSGNLCWRDDPSATHWWEDDEGYYMPIFSNQPYHSCCFKGRPCCPKDLATREFGFVLAVKCEARLKEGDKVTITLRGAGASGGGYMPGDSFVLPVVAAQAARLAGGREGDARQTWAVRRDDEVLPPYVFDPADPQPYAAAPVGLTLRPGDLPFAVGDRFSLALEAARLWWRRDGGAWQTAELSEGAAIDLGDGLSLAPVFGVAPSFVPGDTWRWRAVATHGLDRLRRPRPGQAFAFAGQTCIITADLGSARDLSAIALALIDLPATATATLAGGIDAADEWDEEIPLRQEGPSVHFLTRAARFLRLTIANAGDGGRIGWLWAGSPWTPSSGAEVTLRREYGMVRPGGFNAGALYFGRGDGGSIRWSGDDTWLRQTDLDELLPRLDAIARAGGEPIIFVPDVRRPHGAVLATVDTDAVTISDWLHHQNAAHGVYAVDLPLRAVLL